MSKKKIKKTAEEKAFDYQRELGMIDSVSDDHVIARRMGFYDGFIDGAEWQREQMMDEWLKDRDGCFLDGVEEGKKAMEKQMMEKGYEAFVSAHNTIPVLPMKDVSNLGLDFGDKVRVIVIKEDKK